MPDLTLAEVAALGDLLTQLSPNLALALAEQINRDLTLDSPTIEPVPIQDLLFRADNVAQTTFNLSAPFSAESVFLVSEEVGHLFVDLIEGNAGIDPPVTLLDVQMEKLAAAMNGLARGLAVALTNLTGDMVELEASTTTIGPIALPPVFALDGVAIQARLPLNIPGLIDTELTFLFTPDLARTLATGSSTEIGIDPSDSHGGILGEDELAAMLSGMSGAAGAGTVPSAPAASGDAFGSPMPSQPGSSPFAPFPSAGQEAMPRGLDLILDIPLDVTVELGRVRMLIKDVLELASGSIVELDRVAGEPVDLLVNGRLIAKGEVVVIEDNFGIRITEIISPADRVAGLGKGR